MLNVDQQINSLENIIPPTQYPVPSHPIFPSSSSSHPHLLPILLAPSSLSHPNRWDLQKNQFPLPSGEGQCFTTVSDWWHTDATSHPTAFYSTTELVTIQRIFMANNNRRCNSYSLRWVNLSRETRGWPAPTAGGQSHVNKLLRLNDWVHGCEGLQKSDMKAVLKSLASNLSFRLLATSTASKAFSIMDSFFTDF